MIGVARAALDAATGATPDRGITATAADDQLVRAVAGGDRHALELLYRRHAPWLAGRLAARTSSRELAEEALQDTFLAAWRGARFQSTGGGSERGSSRTEEPGPGSAEGESSSSDAR